MMRITKKVSHFLSAVGSLCPYTLLGKKLWHLARGERGCEKTPLNNRERDLHAKARLGMGISLIGVFCPIFWISLFSGAKREDIYFNAIHSGIVILGGLGYTIMNLMNLEKEKNKRSLAKHNKV